MLDLSTPWAITPQAFTGLLEFVGRVDPHALAMKPTRPLANAPTAERRGDVAIIPVYGPLFQRANFITDLLGLSTTEGIARDVHAALADDSIKRLVLNVDSPGGQASGINELADLIYIAARTQKPIDAYIGATGASAAYWIASAARQISCDVTAILGSIGAVLTLLDTSQRDERDGIRRHEFVSSVSPNKRPDPQTDAGREQLQSLVDELGDVFVKTVARNRNVSVNTVLEDFGAGGQFVGRFAVKQGLADGISSFEDVIGGRPSTAIPREPAKPRKVVHAVGSREYWQAAGEQFWEARKAEVNAK